MSQHFRVGRPAPRVLEAGPVTPWVAVGVILVGSYAAVLNITVVGVALPAIAEELGGRGGALEVDWVVTSFLLGVLLALLLTGWVSDRAGRKAAYIGSLALFGLGALVCVSATTMEIVVAGRFVQGFGGGALMPVGMAVVYDLFPPHRRGSALGIWGVGIMGAPALGPPLGGLIVDAVSWRWIFGVFVIVAVAAMALSARWLPDVGHREERRLDLTGCVLAAVGLTVVVIALRQLTAWGPTSFLTLAFAAVGATTLFALVRRSLRLDDPIIDFGMFAEPSFAAAMLLTALFNLGQFAQLTFLPAELQVVRGLDAGRVGLLLAPAALGTAAMMPVGGWLVDRIGARAPVLVGLSLMAVSMWNLAELQPDGSDGFLVGVLVAQGAGMGLVFVPTTVAALNSLPGRFVAQASAMNHLTGQFGGAIGIAVLGSILVGDLGAVAPIDPNLEATQAAYNRIFLVAAQCIVAAAVVTLLLPGRDAARQHRAARAAEAEGS